MWSVILSTSTKNPTGVEIVAMYTNGIAAQVESLCVSIIQKLYNENRTIASDSKSYDVTLLTVYKDLD